MQENAYENPWLVVDVASVAVDLERGLENFPQSMRFARTPGNAAEGESPEMLALFNDQAGAQKCADGGGPDCRPVRCASPALFKDLLRYMQDRGLVQAALHVGPTASPMYVLALDGFSEQARELAEELAEAGAKS
jgi:hypothetical protein